MTDFSSLSDLSILQSSKFLPLCSTIEIKRFEFTLVHFRYSLESDRPSQTTKYTMFLFKLNELRKNLRVVFQRRFHNLLA